MRALAVTAAVLAASPSAHAQTADDFPVERLHLALEADAVADVGSGAVPGHLGWSLGLWLGHSDDPLVYYDMATGERVGRLVDARLGGALVGTLGLGGR